MGQFIQGLETATCNGQVRSIAHAVSAAGLNSYAYDCNGNMVTRNVGSSTYNLSYDAESRLTGVSGGTSASFVYDGDGNRVKATVAGVTTAFVGDNYEWTSNGNTAYSTAGGAYFAGCDPGGESCTLLVNISCTHISGLDTFIAMHRAGYTSDNGLFWLTADS